MDFQIPLQASLHGIVKTHRYFATQMALRFRSEIFWRNTGLHLASKRGCVEKMHPQVGERVSFPQQIQHSHSESILCFLVFLFDSFALAHLALRANLRLLYRAPAPALGCVHPSHPWLKCLPFASELARDCENPLLILLRK
jgi:hypothetical protein